MTRYQLRKLVSVTLITTGLIVLTFTLLAGIWICHGFWAFVETLRFYVSVRLYWIIGFNIVSIIAGLLIYVSNKEAKSPKVEEPDTDSEPEIGVWPPAPHSMEKK